MNLSMSCLKRFSALIAIIWISVVSFCWVRLPVPGLLASYYSTADWTGSPLFLHREDEIGVDTAEELVKSAGFPPYNFSITWQGWIRIDQERMYEIGTISKDGSSLLIDQQLVVENPGISAAQAIWGSIFLTKGMHRLTITYFKSTRGDALSVFWKDQKGQTTALPPEILFSRALSPDLELFSRHFVSIIVMYGLAWIWLAGWLGMQRYWPTLQTGFKRRALPSVAMQLVLLLIVGGACYDNLCSLRAKQPFISGYLAPMANRKLSTVLPRKGFGDSDAVFMATLRHLYKGATIWLPQDDLFNTDHLLDKGGLHAVRFYPQNLQLTPTEVAHLNRRVYHRFVYDPYGFRQDGDQLDRSVRLTMDTTRRPVFVFVIQPVVLNQSPGTIVVVPYERDLYVLAIQQLPERFQSDVHK